MYVSRGFSLIELMTALAIMGVGMALAVPMFTSLIENSRLTSTANNVVESLAVARSEAIRQRTVMDLVPIDGTWNSGWLVQTEDGVEVARFDAVPGSLTLSASEDVDSIQFQSNGTRTLGSPQFSLTMCAMSGRGRRIDIGIAGTTSVEKIEEGCGE